MSIFAIYSGVHELFFLVSENILSVVVLIAMTASVFLSVIYTLVFIFKPFDPERKEEKNPLLNGCNAQSDEAPAGSAQKWTSTTDGNLNGVLGIYFQMAYLALLFALITAVRLNSVKGLMQLSWPATSDETPEVNLFSAKS